MRLVLLGVPGSGKGTQGAALAAHYGVPLVSMGDLLRAIAASPTERGDRVRAYLDRGDLVPDELVNDSCATHWPASGRAGTCSTGTRGPRPKRARSTRSRPPTPRSNFRCPTKSRGAASPFRAGDGRTDDENRAAVDRRLEHFHEQVDPMLDFYGNAGRLRIVDADRPAGVVTAAIEAALDERPSRPESGDLERARVVVARRRARRASRGARGASATMPNTGRDQTREPTQRDAGARTPQLAHDADDGPADRRAAEEDDRLQREHASPHLGRGLHLHDRGGRGQEGDARPTHRPCPTGT